MSEGSRTAVFAGGGTGGHLYPALAIAERLPPDVATFFLCSSRDIDKEILRKAAVEFVPLNATYPGLKPERAWAFAKSFASSFAAAREVLKRKRSKGPVALVAMGGFVAPPAAMAARALRLPVTLVNLDAEPGKANRFVDRFAERVFTAAEGQRVPKNWTRVGPILRRAVLVSVPPARSKTKLGLDPSLRVLFVSGGSQGAATINDAMRTLVERDRELFKAGGGWQVYHQAGPSKDGGEAHLDALRDAYANAGVRAVVVPFCDQMGHAWNAADLALCRAGAGTVAEVLGTGTPAIFMPYPFHKDDHQTKNAWALSAAGGAIILVDHVDPMMNLPALRDTLRTLLPDPERRRLMREGLIGMAPTDGAATVAQSIAW